MYYITVFDLSWKVADQCAEGPNQSLDLTVEAALQSFYSDVSVAEETIFVSLSHGPLLQA